MDTAPAPTESTTKDDPALRPPTPETPQDGLPTAEAATLSETARLDLLS